MLVSFLETVTTNNHKLGSLKQQKFVLSQVLEGRSLKSRCHQGWFLLEAPKENLFCASLLPSGGCWQCLVFLKSIAPTSVFIFTWRSSPCVSVFTWLSLLRLCVSSCSYQDLSHWIRAHSHLLYPHLKLDYVYKILLLNKVTSWDHSWEWIVGDAVQPIAKSNEFKIHAEGSEFDFMSHWGMVDWLWFGMWCDSIGHSYTPHPPPRPPHLPQNLLIQGD